jgi:hypothetical protein
MTVRIGYRPAPVHEAVRRHFPVALATWATGAGLFLCLAIITVTVALSWPDEDMPRGVATDQQARTQLAAGQVRRALDGGISDLTAVAAGIEALEDAGTPSRLLTRLVATRPRYRGAAYLAPTGEIRARAGADIDPTTASAAVLVRAPHVFVSVPVTGARAGVLVAELTPDTLSTPLTVAGPGDTHLFDSGGRGVDATGATEVTLPATRPGHALRDVHGRTAVVSWAPVPGQAGLTVVTDRPEPRRATEKHALLLLGVLVATLTVVIFGWLHTLVIGPLSAVAKAADRLARGDTDDPVIVRRYDRLGLIARDLERIRRDLLRRN